ncbi:MAG: hypothetical protein SWH61_03300 [Thermodesulfobacteriota bacterium]|nr:hypothetical protein [Thermodesulfobacteriota bacterium]
MPNHLTSNADNIRYNGTGRAYLAEVGGSSYKDLGELDGFSGNVSVSKDELKTTRTADRSTILTVESGRGATFSFGLREQTEENLKLALMGSDIIADDQSAGSVVSEETALVDDEYIDLGHVNTFLTKLTGAITGSLSPGDEITGATSGATGTIAWTESDLVELVEVDGTFVAGEAAQLDISNYITITGVSTVNDVVVVDADVDSATPTTRYEQGTDYTLDPDYGLIRMLSAGSITSPAYVSYDYEAVTRNHFHAMSASTVQKKLLFVTDKDDQGRRYRITVHKMDINMDGDWSLIGDGESVLPCSGTLIKDTSQPVGQEYWKHEVMS